MRRKLLRTILIDIAHTQVYPKAPRPSRLFIRLVYAICDVGFDMLMYELWPCYGVCRHVRNVIIDGGFAWFEPALSVRLFELLIQICGYGSGGGIFAGLGRM